MNLVCPHCAKVVEIHTDLAGKTTNCPLCAGPFTVPLVPPDLLSAMKAPKELPPPAASAPPPETPADNPGPRSETEAAPSAAPSLSPIGDESPPPFGETGSPVFRLVLALPGKAIPFIAPAAMVLMLVLLFMPWVGAYLGLTFLAEQSGFGVAFGSATWSEGITPFPHLGMSLYLFVHFLCLVLGLIVYAALLFARHAPEAWRQPVEKWTEQLLALRLPLICGFTLLSLACLAMLLFVNLPFEREATGEGVQQLLKDGMQKKFGVTPQHLETDVVKSQWIQRGIWYGVAFLLNLIAALGALAEWQRARHPQRPLPHLEIVWGDRG